MSNNLFKLRAKLSSQQSLMIQGIGIILIVLIWAMIGYFQWVPRKILPPPWEVLASFQVLHFEDGLVRNAFISIGRNVLGYMEALAISIPIGFMIGLFPVFRGLFGKQFDALRFLPLTAVTGLFIAWFGLDDNMKVQFLAFGIIVYLIPVVVQRIDDVEEVYLQTVFTLGANKWQTIKAVFMPAVFSKISDDIRVLVAISWTYIIAAEVVNTNAGGIGALAYTAARQSRIDKVFAILLIIILIGFIQDKLFAWLDKLLFPYKHQNK